MYTTFSHFACCGAEHQLLPVSSIAFHSGVGCGIPFTVISFITMSDKFVIHVHITASISLNQNMTWNQKLCKWTEFQQKTHPPIVYSTAFEKHEWPIRGTCPFIHTTNYFSTFPDSIVGAKYTLWGLHYVVFISQSGFSYSSWCDGYWMMMRWSQWNVIQSQFKEMWLCNFTNSVNIFTFFHFSVDDWKSTE